MRFIFIAMSLVAVVAADARASEFVTSGKCALIVASRKTVDEVREFRALNPGIPNGPVFRSSNGWLAISAGELNKTNSRTQIDDLVARRKIPADSYCSDGSAYTSQLPRDQLAEPISTPVMHGANAEFDARPMTFDEKRLLQASLALRQKYNGLIDGRWGAGSQRALEKFSLDEFGEEPSNLHAAAVLMMGINELVENDWRPKTFPNVGVSFLLPASQFNQESDAGTYKLDNSSGSILLRVSSVDFEVMRGVHSGKVMRPKPSSDPYVLRQPQLWITSYEAEAGTIYVWSGKEPIGSWATVVVFFDGTEGAANLIIGSISPVTVKPLTFDEGGYVDRYVSDLVAVLNEPEIGGGDRRPSISSEVDGVPNSSGTGFVAAPDGKILTNAHVVEGCRQVTANGAPVQVIKLDPDFDLALLSGPSNPRSWLRFSDQPANLNSDVTIAGYPLHGILSGLNVTRGAVSSLTGITGDKFNIQISAPVQPGNSGGPVVDEFGRVIGVVVAKLDSQSLADATGELPENVNFAVRGEIAKLFLSSAGVKIQTAPPSSPLSGVELADLLSVSTLLLECER